MYDVNPIGLKMYLKELDRNAAPQLKPVVSFGKQRPALYRLSIAIIGVAVRALRPVVPGLTPGKAVNGSVAAGPNVIAAERRQ
jgi:hypothetical protein